MCTDFAAVISRKQWHNGPCLSDLACPGLNFRKEYVYELMSDEQHWVLHISQKYVSTSQVFGTNIRIKRKSQKYGSTPQMFDTNIRIELKMLHFMHITEICLHPLECFARISG